MQDKMSNSREPQYSEPPEFDAAYAKNPEAAEAEPRRSEGPAPSEMRHQEPGVEAFASTESVEPRDLGPLDGTTDSMLSRYFRDMATHQVMGPDEELECAQAVEEAEIEHWVALLSYVPVAESIVDRLEKDIAEASEADRPEVPQVEELRNQVKIYRKQDWEQAAAQAIEFLRESCG